MAILLDGQPVACLVDADQSLRAVLEAVRREHAPDRIIVRIERDGQVLEGQVLDAALASPLDTGSQLVLHTENPRALVARALREVGESLRRAVEQSAQAADALEQGDLAAALAVVQPTLAPWRDLQQVIQQAGALLGEDWLTQELEDEPLHAHLSVLAQRLRDMRDALLSQDRVLLADVLRYELPELAEAWATRLETLAEITNPVADRTS